MVVADTRFQATDRFLRNIRMVELCAWQDFPKQVTRQTMSRIICRPVPPDLVVDHGDNLVHHAVVHHICSLRHVHCTAALAAATFNSIHCRFSLQSAQGSVLL